jgi:hypothetical protein
MYSVVMTLGGGLGGGSSSGGFTPEGSRRVEREGRAQFDSPSYAVSLRSVLIVVALLLALIAAVIVVLT